MMKTARPLPCLSWGAAILGLNAFILRESTLTAADGVARAAASGRRVGGGIESNGRTSYWRAAAVLPRCCRCVRLSERYAGARAGPSCHGGGLGQTRAAKALALATAARNGPWPQPRIGCRGAWPSRHANVPARSARSVHTGVQKVHSPAESDSCGKQSERGKSRRFPCATQYVRTALWVRAVRIATPPPYRWPAQCPASHCKAPAATPIPRHCMATDAPRAASSAQSAPSQFQHGVPFLDARIRAISTCLRCCHPPHQTTLGIFSVFPKAFLFRHVLI